MSSTITKNCNFKDLVACGTCLATDRKLFSINNNNLFESYKNLVRNEVFSIESLPPYICNYCATLLLKFNAFRRNCKLSQKLLEDGISKQHLTTKYILKLQKSATKIIDIFQDEVNDLKSDCYDDNSAHDNYDYTQNIEDKDTKILTDIIKHEILATDKTKYTQSPNNSQSKDSKSKNSKEIHSKPSSTNSNSTIEDLKYSQNIEQIDVTKKKGKYFETDENMRDFEKEYNVEIIILSPEQQKKDVLDRKLSSNYLDSLYKCELCYKGVMDKDSLNKHILYQHDPSRGSIICEYCSFRYKDKRGLNQHLKSHRLKFACKQCPYVSRTTFNAKEHHKMHTGHTHKCRHCGKSYEKLSSHLTHLRIHHPSEFIWCSICGEAFIGEFGLNAHKKRAHRHLNLPFHCESCEIYFANEAALTRHKLYESCSKLSCVHCGECFNKSMDLREHLLSKHRNYKVYVCEKCNKTFSRQSLHSAHYRRAHLETKDKRALRPWVCEICGKTLPNKCVLQYHQRNHTGEKPYQCSQCHKSFTMRKLLQSHLRVHTNDRPYACKLCPKAFKGLSALRAHENIHTGGQRKSVHRKP